MENSGNNQQSSQVAQKGIAENLRAVLPDFGEAELVASAQGCVQFRATHSSGQTYSVFITPERLSGYTEADRQGFLTDAKLAMAVEHPNLIRTLHVTRIPGHFAVITELAEGQTLGDLIREKKVDRNTAVDWLRPLADAVSALHDAGVVHRAINPDAVLVSKEGRPRLTGAGFANLLFPLWEKRTAETGLRLQSFMAPETGVDGLSGADARADLFSLGMIYYLALTGAVPKGSFFALPSQKARVESFIDSAVSRAIQSKPAQRHRDMAEFFEEISGLRPKEAPGIDFSRKEESVPRHRETDGMLSWLTRKRVCMLVVFFLLLGSAAAYIVWEKKKLRESLTAEDIQSILARLAEAQSDLKAGRTAAALSKLTDVAKNAEVSREVLKKMMGMLIEAGEYEKALEIGEMFASRAEEGMEDYEEFMALFDDMKDNIGEFLDVRALASRAKDGDQSAMEYDLLRRATELMPHDKNIRSLLEENPHYVEKLIAGAMRQLKAKNSRQEEWKYFASVRRGRAELNLSGNTYLTDISPLDGLPLQALDLSDTGVSNLLSLGKMPLVELRLDRCPVQTLEPLSGLPLRLLAMNGTGVRFPGKEWYTSIPHRPGDSTCVRKSPSVPGVWENSGGMRFRPLPDAGHALIAEREVTVAEFERFLERSTRTNRSRSILAFNESSQAWERVETGDWNTNGIQDLSGGHPVVGVNVSDCEDFCEWLTSKERRAGVLTEKQFYRLPTDHEWSLAAGLSENPMTDGAGRLVNHARSGPAYREQALVLSEGYESTIDANHRAKTAGEWLRMCGATLPEDGAFDLGGNAREWCLDTVDSAGKFHIIRGGSAELGQGARRQRATAHRLSRYGDVGFRIVLELYPPRDYSKLAILIAKNESEKARRLAQEYGINRSSAGLRDAGQSALDLIDFISRPPTAEQDRRLKTFQGSRYYLARFPAGWKQASEIAEAAGGHLVSVTSAEEEQWLARHFFHQSEETPAVWLGASNGTGGDRWSWTTMEPWKDKPAELPPAQDDPEKPDYREAALVLAPGEVRGDGRAAVWKKRPCSEPHAFVIEWDEDSQAPVISDQAIRPGKKSGLAQVPEAE